MFVPVYCTFYLEYFPCFTLQKEISLIVILTVDNTDYG